MTQPSSSSSKLCTTLASIQALHNLLKTNGRLMQREVRLIPCLHSMEQAEAEQLSEGSNDNQYQCPNCENPVLSYVPDYRLRQIASILSKIHERAIETQSFDHVDTPIPLTEKEIYELSRLINCPVALEPLNECVILFPCAHRIQAKVAIHMYGAMNEEQIKKCPECRSSLVQCYSDLRMGQVSEALSQMIKIAEVRKLLVANADFMKACEAVVDVIVHRPDSLTQVDSVYFKKYEQIAKTANDKLNELMDSLSINKDHPDWDIYFKVGKELVLEQLSYEDGFFIKGLNKLELDDVEHPTAMNIAQLRFKEAAFALANASFVRFFPLSESSTFSFTYFIENPRDIAEQGARYNKANENFYEAFYNLIRTFEIDEMGSRFPEIVTNSMEHFFNAFMTPPLSIKMQMVSDKFGTTAHLYVMNTLNAMRQEFLTTIFKDMIRKHATQELHQITPQSISEMVVRIQSMFPDMTDAQIKESFYDAIRETHELREINAMRNRYLVPSDSPHFIALRSDLESKLKNEKKEIEEELARYRGSNGFNGEYHEAWEAMNNAEKKLRSEVIKAYLTLFGTIGDLHVKVFKVRDVDDLISLFGQRLNVLASVTDQNILASMHKKHNQLLELLENRKVCTERFNKIKKRFDKIAIFQPGTSNICGGRLHDISQTLDQPANVDAMITAFYGSFL